MLNWWSRHFKLQSNDLRLAESKERYAATMFCRWVKSSIYYDGQEFSGNNQSTDFLIHFLRRYLLYRYLLPVLHIFFLDTAQSLWMRSCPNSLSNCVHNVSSKKPLGRTAGIRSWEITENWYHPIMPENPIAVCPKRDAVVWFTKHTVCGTSGILFYPTACNLHGGSSRAYSFCISSVKILHCN